MEILKRSVVSSTTLYDNFRYSLIETPKSLKLVESYIGNDAKIGQVRAWKRHILSEIDRCFVGNDERERGYRLFLAVKALNRLKDAAKAPMFMRVMRELTLEEAIFWVWQYHSHGNKAINAFNCIYLSRAK